MDFLKKKKENDLKPLTENEIQKKLYGEFEGELVPPSAVSGKVVPSKEEVKNPALLKPQIASSQNVPAPSQDLFDASRLTPVTDRSAKRTTPMTTVEEIKQDRDRMTRLTQLAEKEEASRPPIPVKHVRPKAPLSKTSVSGPEGIFFRRFANQLTGAMKAALIFFVELILSVFKFAYKGLRGLLSFIDLRKAQIQRALYWMVGLLILFGLFAGIHFLNVRREAALKEPRKTASAVRKTADEKVAQIPSEVKKRKVSPAESSALAPAGSPVSGETTKTVPVVPVERDSLSDAANHPYVIQIATYANSDDANRVLEDLKRSGLSSPFVKSISRPSGKVYYSVFVGRFVSFQEAQRYFKEFKKSDSAKLFQDAFIRVLT